MKRVCACIVVLTLFAVFHARVVEAASLDADAMQVALHTATPEEEGFIEYVVARTEAGTLPVSLVKSTFLWARRKNRNRFQYFKRGLIVRAAKEGIRL